MRGVSLQSLSKRLTHGTFDLYASFLKLHVMSTRAASRSLPGAALPLLLSHHTRCSAQPVWHNQPRQRL